MFLLTDSIFLKVKLENTLKKWKKNLSILPYFNINFDINQVATTIEKK